MWKIKQDSPCFT